ncbi:MAG: crossover junction endodeoxyribonuclease RuvC [Spirochaetales bacterium]
MGVDPGLASTGYGIIVCEGSRIMHETHGVIRTQSSETAGARLLRIFEQIQGLCDTYKPAAAGIESLYFASNVTSALPVAQARGVVLLAFAQAGIPASEYPPQAIKQALVGEGRADKHQVAEFVRLLLGMPAVPKPDHAADALAAAVCHFNTRGMYV